MIRQLALASAIVLCASGAAIAQESDTVTLPLITADELSEVLIGAPLLSSQEKYELTQDPQYDVANDESLFVVEGGTVKDAGTWTAADSEACKNSGGIELPISAGRIACFKL